MPAPQLTSEDVKLISAQVVSICSFLSVYDDDNGHVSDRRKTNVKRHTICKGEVTLLDEPVLKLHTLSPKLGTDFRVEITRVSPIKVRLEFEVGDVTTENINVLKEELSELLSKLEVDVPKKLSGVKTPISTSNWEGFYIYRGEISEVNRYFKNFEEAVRQNYASPEFIQSMKEWNLHFRDY